MANARWLEHQAVLFAAQPSRLALTQLNPSAEGLRPVNIQVLRNHALEPVATLAQPYLAHAGLNATFSFGDYDDSLALPTDTGEHDLHLLWIDSTRYQSAFSGWLVWLHERLAALRSRSHKPILLVTWAPKKDLSSTLLAVATGLPGVEVVDLAVTCDALEVQLLDPRTALVAGTPVSRQAQLIVARWLGSSWLPAILTPAIKAVALDLDNTLHDGVLGEDGVTGVALTPAHAALQSYCKNLIEQGIFLALVSRNRRADVDELFTKRTDYPLRLSDFSVVEVSWGEKAEALARVADQLRIGVDAVLFVDDNIGELLSVAQRLPTIKLLRAEAEAGATLSALKHYPGMFRWRTSVEDALRNTDLLANAERTRLADEDPAAYFASLNVQLSVGCNLPSQLPRLGDLAKKTNQFNLGLQRLSEAALAERAQRPASAAVVGVQLTDRLSDSGVIALVTAELKDGTLEVDEICISCRALGRQLESTIIFEAIRAMPAFAQAKHIGFRYQIGPRNQPALEWLAGEASTGPLTEPQLIVLDKSRIADSAPHPALRIQNISA
jgi:FkbH-like protein